MNLINLVRRRAQLRIFGEGDKLIKDRIKTLSDIKENAFYFFNHPTEYDEAAMKNVGAKTLMIY